MTRVLSFLAVVLLATQVAAAPPKKAAKPASRPPPPPPAASTPRPPDEAPTPSRGGGGGGGGGSAPAPSADSAPLGRTGGGPTRVEFDDRLVQGQSNKQGAIYLFERKEAPLRSMLRKRQNFRGEMTDSIR